MRIIRIKKYIERTIYVAFDGVEFDYEDDCLRYEAFIQNIESFHDDYEVFESKELRWFIVRRSEDILQLMSFLRLDLDKMDPNSDPIVGDGTEIITPVLLILHPTKGDWKFFTMDTFIEVYQMETRYKLIRDIDELKLIADGQKLLNNFASTTEPETPEEEVDEPTESEEPTV